MEFLFSLLIAFLVPTTANASCSCTYTSKKYIERPNYNHYRKRAIVQCFYECKDTQGQKSEVSYTFKKSFTFEFQGTLGCTGVQYTVDQLMNPKSIAYPFNPMRIIRRFKYSTFIDWGKANNCPGWFSTQEAHAAPRQAVR